MSNFWKLGFWPAVRQGRWRITLAVFIGLFLLLSTLPAYAGAGDISTVAGGGLGDGGAAIDASFYNPQSVAVDGAGDIYIADYHNHRIRKVDVNGIISTVAGNGSYGYSGDGGPATSARLGSPHGVGQATSTLPTVTTTASARWMLTVLFRLWRGMVR